MTDNRTNEPTEAQVEAAAKELAYIDGRPWERMHVGSRMHYRDCARAALVAAQEAAPVPSSGVDVDALAEVIARAVVAYLRGES